MITRCLARRLWFALPRFASSRLPFAPSRLSGSSARSPSLPRWPFLPSSAPPLSPRVRPRFPRASRIRFPARLFRPWPSPARRLLPRNKVNFWTMFVTPSEPMNPERAFLRYSSSLVLSSPSLPCLRLDLVLCAPLPFWRRPVLASGPICSLVAAFPRWGLSHRFWSRLRSGGFFFFPAVPGLRGPPTSSRAHRPTRSVSALPPPAWFLNLLLCALFSSAPPCRCAVLTSRFFGCFSPFFCISLPLSRPRRLAHASSFSGVLLSSFSCVFLASPLSAFIARLASHSFSDTSYTPPFPYIMKGNDVELRKQSTITRTLWLH